MNKLILNNREFELEEIFEFDTMRNMFNKSYDFKFYDVEEGIIRRFKIKAASSSKNGINNIHLEGEDSLSGELIKSKPISNRTEREAKAVSEDSSQTIHQQNKELMDKDYTKNEIKEAIITFKRYSNNNEDNLIKVSDLKKKFGIDKEVGK